MHVTVCLAQVPREKVAPVGACLGTLYGGLERQPLIKEWATHMHVRALSASSY